MMSVFAGSAPSTHALITMDNKKTHERFESIFLSLKMCLRGLS
jgi:hypothetical protein